MLNICDTNVLILKHNHKFVNIQFYITLPYNMAILQRVYIKFIPASQYTTLMWWVQTKSYSYKNVQEIYLE